MKKKPPVKVHLNGQKTTGKTTVAVGELVKQAHGGALRNGGTNAGGAGRPPSAIREHLRGSFAERVSVLERIADGGAAQRIEIPLSKILKYAKCPRCSGKLDPIDKDTVDSVVIKGRVSASIRDRLSSLDLMAKYGLGTTKELTVENVRERLKVTIEILQNELTADQLKSVMPQLRAVWRG